MKTLFYVFIFAPFMLTACKGKKNVSVPATEEMNLKRGDVISCGPSQKEFGKVRFATTCTPETQGDFDLAVSMLHSFEYDEAEKVFAKVIEEAPACAMAYWGVAMSNYHPLWAPPTQEELAKGNKAITIAQSLAGGSKTENGYIKALAAFYKDYPTVDHKTRSGNYKNEMEKLYLTDTSDKELAIFYSLALIATADPTDKTFANRKKAGEILGALYPEGKNHPGIIHYIIHTYDVPELAALGLDAAKRYAAVAPSSAHAQHMPSHIFTRLGLWDDDITSNLAASSSAQCYAAAANLDGHWSEELHAADYLVYSYLQKGDNVSAQKEVAYVDTITKVSGIANTNAYALAAIHSRYALENKLWKEAVSLKLHPVMGDAWKRFVWQAAIVHFARLLGADNTGDHALAKEELKTLNAIYDTLVARKDNYSAAQVMIQIKSGTAWMAWKEGNSSGALTTMQEAVELEDKTDKHPVTPGEVLPARQLFADMLLEMNKPAEALGAYEADLKKHPNRFNSLYGAAYCSEKTGNAAKAESYYHQLLAVANNPGSNRPELELAKKFVEKNHKKQIALR
ncbi:MAG: tetratricopeptide repeat protein [Chitinophagaceae bacterium]|nr:tetratricopeptide repeat protein [Chitinophagaceae bacterium]